MQIHTKLKPRNELNELQLHVLDQSSSGAVNLEGPYANILRNNTDNTHICFKKRKTKEFWSACHKKVPGEEKLIVFFFTTRNQ